MIAATALASIAACGVAHAQQPSPNAQLTGVQGSVLVSDTDAMAAAANGHPLAPGMRVLTTAASKATIAYAKGCEVRLGENTRYTVRANAECSRAKAPPLGAGTSFAVIAGSHVANSGESVVKGDLGVAPGTSITGFPGGRVVGGSVHPNDDLATRAQKDIAAAYADIVQQPCNTRLSGQDLGGQTLTDGVYCFPGMAAKLTGELVLDGQGDITSVFIFQIGTTLGVADKARVKLVNGAQACNVFWQVGDSAMLGREAKFAGNLIPLQGVGAAPGASIHGRALARNGAVTMDSDGVEVPPCIAAGAAFAGGVTTGALIGAGAIVGAGVGVYEGTRDSRSPN